MDRKFQGFGLRTCVVGELDRVDWIDLDSMRLEREDGTFVAYIAMYYVGLDG
jgi:hypothetical protein